MNVRAAVNEVVRLGARGNPPPTAWTALLTAAGLDAEQATALPQRLGLSFHLGAYDEDAVTGQLRQWADALRVRAMPDEAARLDAAVGFLTADPAAPGLTPPAEQPPAPAPPPESVSPPTPDPSPAPHPQTAGSQTPQSQAGGSPERRSQPAPPEALRPPAARLSTPRESASGRATGAAPRSPSASRVATKQPGRSRLGVAAVAVAIAVPMVILLVGVLSGGDPTRDRVTSWTPPTAPPATAPVDPLPPVDSADLPDNRSKDIAETEVLGDEAVGVRLVAEADRVVASLQQTAQQLGVALSTPSREYRRLGCDEETDSGVKLYRSTIELETEPVDAQTAFTLVAGLPDPDQTDNREALAHPRLDGTVTRIDHVWFTGPGGRDHVSRGSVDTYWFPGGTHPQGLDITITSPCHLLEADRDETAAGAVALPALERPWVRGSDDRLTATEIEQWWANASVDVPRAVEAGARAAGVELTLLEIGPRHDSFCSTAVDADGNRFVGRSSAWVSRQPLTEAQAKSVWDRVADLAPEADEDEEDSAGARYDSGARVQGLDGRGGYQELGHVDSHLATSFSQGGGGQLQISLDSPCGVG